MQEIRLIIKSEMNVKVVIDPRTGAATAIQDEDAQNSAP